MECIQLYEVMHETEKEKGAREISLVVVKEEEQNNGQRHPTTKMPQNPAKTERSDEAGKVMTRSFLFVSLAYSIDVIHG